MASKKKKSQKKTATAAGTGKSIQKRKKTVSRRNDRWASAAAPLPSLVVRRPAPAISSKHTTYFEIVENKEKKKKLEFKVTTDRIPPPGFEFVPIGNPDLTKACKELSREQDAMIFIVSAMDHGDGSQLGLHMNRVGHHIRRTIVEQARSSLGQPSDYCLGTANNKRPEPIPQTQEEINAQADAAIRDLFPRMPNTDRQIVIDRSFRKGGGETVGLAADLTLSRRVQLAVLAHIRHTHTTYDDLWRTHGWATARKAIEATCLDFIVKWRGDEETGRDQLDEILREVIVISDSEDSDDDEEDDDDDDDDDSEDEDSETEDSDQTESGEVDVDRSSPRAREPYRPDPYRPVYVSRGRGDQFQPAHMPASSDAVFHRRSNPANFKRYEAAAQSRWEQAQERVRHQYVPLEMSTRLPPSRGVGIHLDLQPLQAYNVHNKPPLPQAREYRQQSQQQGLQRVGMPLNGPHRPVDPSAQLSPVARGLELKDYLVPSIEPKSPENPNGPIFVRALPPRVYGRPSPSVPVRRRSRSPAKRSPQPSTVLGHPNQRAPFYDGCNDAAVKYSYDGAGPMIHAGSSEMAGMGKRGQVSYSVMPDDREKYRDAHPHPHHHIVGSSRLQEMSQPWSTQRGMAPTVVSQPQRPHPSHHEMALLRTERRPILVEDWERPPQTPQRPISAGTRGRAVLVEDWGRYATAFAPARSDRVDGSYTTTVHGRELAPHDLAGLPVVDQNDPRATAYSRSFLTSREVYPQPHTQERPRNQEQIPAQSHSAVPRPASSQHYSIPAAAPSHRQHIYPEDMSSLQFNNGYRVEERFGEPSRARMPPPGNYLDTVHPQQARQRPTEMDRRPPNFPPHMGYIQLD